jgi:hypothetical protein
MTDDTEPKRRKRRRAVRKRTLATSQPRLLESRERAGRAFEMRKAGLSYQQIARALGYKTSRVAYNAVQRTLRMCVAEPAEGLRQLELQRLETIIARRWHAALVDGDGASLRAILKACEMRCRLLGFFESTPQVHVTNVYGDAPPDRAQIVADIKTLQNYMLSLAPPGQLGMGDVIDGEIVERRKGNGGR